MDSKTLSGAGGRRTPELHSWRLQTAIADELPPISQEEQAYLDNVADWGATEGAYEHLLGTKPQTLSYALTDSPVGLAAWIIEKFRSWSDCTGDVEQTFGFDTLLTDISLYWFSDDINVPLSAVRV